MRSPYSQVGTFRTQIFIIFVIPEEFKERWQSGRLRRSRKPLFAFRRTGGSNPPLSAKPNKPRVSGVIYFTEDPLKACFQKGLRENK